MNRVNQIPHPIEILHGGGSALACGLDGELHADAFHGFFVRDTRLLSTYGISLNGSPWRCLRRTRAGHGTAEWELVNPRVSDPFGEIPDSSLLLSLHRRVDGLLRDDLRIHSFGDRAHRLRLMVRLDADFADLFEVKDRIHRPRLSIRRRESADRTELRYSTRGFERAVHIRVATTGSPPEKFGALLMFTIKLEPGERWECRLEVIPEIEGELLGTKTDPNGPETPAAGPEKECSLAAPEILSLPFEQGVRDLRGLVVARNGRTPYIAAGAPWFLTLFARDVLLTSLMTGILGPWTSHGALEATAELQAKERDDWRDAEPGKLPHEVREGELARTGRIPHSAYYGAHDAPALFCLALWNAWRWTGDRKLLLRYRANAEAALKWCTELGDRDGDGFLEYKTRSPHGYRNQSWMDSGNAIFHEDGSPPKLPLATVELQGYLFAALLAWAEILEELGDPEDALRHRTRARDLRYAVERSYWREDAGYYAVALDGDKARVAGVGSNPGHLFWCGLPEHERAEQVANRILAPDLFSGWGLRTLSSRNPAYNPLGYQRGSVWPHDTLLVAAGLLRYGERAAAAALVRALLEAASGFELSRLPELFCGLDRAFGLPIPYEKANSPQAWAAAAPVLSAQLFAGLVPDAPRGRVFVDPWLPDWLPSLELKNLAIGSGRLNLTLKRRENQTMIERAEASGIEVIAGAVEAPLWGRPMDQGRTLSTPLSMAERPAS